MSDNLINIQEIINKFGEKQQHDNIDSEMALPGANERDALACLATGILRMQKALEKMGMCQNCEHRYKVMTGNGICCALAPIKDAFQIFNNRTARDASLLKQLEAQLRAEQEKKAYYEKALMKMDKDDGEREYKEDKETMRKHGYC